MGIIHKLWYFALFTKKEVVLTCGIIQSIPRMFLLQRTVSTNTFSVIFHALISTGYVLLLHTRRLEPRLLTRINCIVTLAGISNYIHWKVWCEITYPFPNFTGCSFEVWDWISNSSHMLLGMWLLINAGIKVNSWLQKRHLHVETTGRDQHFDAEMKCPSFCRRYNQIKKPHIYVPGDPIDNKSASVLAMVNCRKITSHYVNRWWPNSITHIESPGLVLSRTQLNHVFLELIHSYINCIGVKWQRSKSIFLSRK